MSGWRGSLRYDRPGLGLAPGEVAEYRRPSVFWRIVRNVASALVLVACAWLVFVWAILGAGN